MRLNVSQGTCVGGDFRRSFQGVGLERFQIHVETQNLPRVVVADQLDLDFCFPVLERSICNVRSSSNLPIFRSKTHVRLALGTIITLESAELVGQGIEQKANLKVRGHLTKLRTGPLDEFVFRPGGDNRRNASRPRMPYLMRPACYRHRRRTR